MGRPLKKDVNGVDAIGSFTGAATGVRVEFYDASLRTDGVIVKQRGAKTFVVANQAGTRAVCVLQSAIPSAAGQMRINGYIGGNGAIPTPIAKITKRVATDFNGKRYTWVLLNDSSSDYIVLTAT
jgi:hypothetical protein